MDAAGKTHATSFSWVSASIRFAHPIRDAVPSWVIGFGVLLGSCTATRPAAELAYFPAPPSPARVVQLRTFRRLEELVPPKPDPLSLFRQARGSAIGRPAGLAYAAGHLLICDLELACVHDWDLETGTARRVHDAEGVEFLHPVAVAVDDDGRWYVADTDRGEVIRSTASGSDVRRIKPAGGARFRPVSVAVHMDNLFVADIAAHEIQVYSTATGDLVRHIGGVGDEPGKFYFPLGVASTRDGRLLVSDTMNSRVQVFDPQSHFLRAFGQPGNRFGDMGKPKHLGVSHDGVVFVADAEFECVHVFSDEGQLLLVLVGDDGRRKGTGVPFGIALAYDVPAAVSSLVPADFNAEYFVFLSNGAGSLGVYAVGVGR